MLSPLGKRLPFLKGRACLLPFCLPRIHHRVGTRSPFLSSIHRHLLWEMLRWDKERHKSKQHIPPSFRSQRAVLNSDVAQLQTASPCLLSFPVFSPERSSPERRRNELAVFKQLVTKTAQGNDAVQSLMCDLLIQLASDPFSKCIRGCTAKHRFETLPWAPHSGKKGTFTTKACHLDVRSYRQKQHMTPPHQSKGISVSTSQPHIQLRLQSVS